jgi:hypothetical protein
VTLSPSQETREIEAFEQKLSSDLHRKTVAKVEAAAKKGSFIEYDSEYKTLRDKLWERTRKGKDTAANEGQALEAEWSKQIPVIGNRLRPRRLGTVTA